MLKYTKQHTITEEEPSGDIPQEENESEETVEILSFTKETYLLSDEQLFVFLLISIFLIVFIVLFPIQLQHTTFTVFTKNSTHNNITHSIPAYTEATTNHSWFWSFSFLIIAFGIVILYCIVNAIRYIKGIPIEPVVYSLFGYPIPVAFVLQLLFILTIFIASFSIPIVLDNYYIGTHVINYETNPMYRIIASFTPMYLFLLFWIVFLFAFYFGKVVNNCSPYATTRTVSTHKITVWSFVFQLFIICSLILFIVFLDIGLSNNSYGITQKSSVTNIFVMLYIAFAFFCVWCFYMFMKLRKYQRVIIQEE